MPMTPIALARLMHDVCRQRAGRTNDSDWLWGRLPPWARDDYIAAAEVAIEALTKRKRHRGRCGCQAELFGGSK